MSGVQTITVNAGEAGMRLDRWFKARFPHLRHSELEKLLRTGQVRVGGGRVKANRRLEAGEAVRVPPLPKEDAERGAPRERAPHDPAKAAADIEFIRRLTVFEDKHFIALNKPFGLAVQGGAKTRVHIDGMLGALEKSGERPRLVHRLDRDTGGLLLLAKTRAAAARLSKSFQHHEVDKTYWALVAGAPRPSEGTINLPIAKRMVKSDEERELMVPADGEDSKNAVTDFQTVEDAGGSAAFLALRPRTGRTHQLRVHCAAMGTPIVGDGKYGGPAAKLEGVSPKLHLFCRSMTFPHPDTGKATTLKVPLTGHMLETWKFFSFSEKAEVRWPEDL